jgi:hypothetical protein
MLKEFTIDLEDAPQQLEDQIDQAKQAEETLLDKVDSKYPEDGFHDSECPDDYEEKFYELREQQADLQEKKARIEEFLSDPEQAGEWSHYEFTFQEPSAEDGLYIQGRSAAMAEEAEQRGEKVPGGVFGVTQLLERIRKDAPPEAPDDLAHSLPRKVGDWLVDELNEEMSHGAVDDLGNTSPQEALQNYKSTQPS